MGKSLKCWSLIKILFTDSTFMSILAFCSSITELRENYIKLSPAFSNEWIWTLKTQWHHAGLGQNKFLNDQSLFKVGRNLCMNYLTRTGPPQGIYKITFFTTLTILTRLSPARSHRWKLRATCHYEGYLDYAFSSGKYLWTGGRNHMVWRGQFFTWLFSFGTSSFYVFSSCLILIFGTALTTLWRRAGRGPGTLFTLIPSGTRGTPVSYCCGCSCLALASEPQKCSLVASPTR